MNTETPGNESGNSYVQELHKQAIREDKFKPVWFIYLPIAALIALIAVACYFNFWL